MIHYICAKFARISLQKIQKSIMKMLFLVIYAMKRHTQSVQRCGANYYLHIKLITKEIVLKLKLLVCVQ